MIKIEIRDDNWFDWEKNAPKKSKKCQLYRSKMIMKKELEKIGEQDSIGELKKRLREIVFKDDYFRKAPRILGMSIMCALYDDPKRAYLGKIVYNTVKVEDLEEIANQ